MKTTGLDTPLPKLRSPRKFLESLLGKGIVVMGPPRVQSLGSRLLDPLNCLKQNVKRLSHWQLEEVQVEASQALPVLARLSGLL